MSATLDVLESHFPSEETLSRLAIAIENSNAQKSEKTILEASSADIITAQQAMATLLETTPDVAHRNIYRGKNLGTSLTNTQKAAIANGTFSDLYVGDYWTINGRVYRIADVDYYLYCGDTSFTDHHLVIVPDASFGNDKMNDTNVTTGAYVGSKMYTDTTTPSVLNAARTTIANDFGTALATHRNYFKNTVAAGGYESNGAWYDSTVDLMTEIMVYGHNVFHNCVNGTGWPYNYTIEKSQLALFRLNPKLIFSRSYNYWLRDVASSTHFARVNGSGNASATGASNSCGVRPAFCIKGS